MTARTRFRAAVRRGALLEVTDRLTIRACRVVKVNSASFYLVPDGAIFATRRDRTRVPWPSADRLVEEVGGQVWKLLDDDGAVALTFRLVQR